MSLPVHGGDVSKVAQQFGIPADQILDFSANINYRGLPERAARQLRMDAAEPNTFFRYPDSDSHQLRDRLSRRLGVTKDSIIIGAGAAALIMDIVRALRPRHSIALIPAFCEYERAFSAAGSEVRCLPLYEHLDFECDTKALARALHDIRADLLILNNPHNPSGAVVDPLRLGRIVDAAEKCGTAVLIDEAFIDYAPGFEITARAAIRPGLIAVRSLTKFYGCPGLRIGYAVAHPDVARQISDQLPAWAVSTMAMNALDEALCDEEYARSTIDENERERNRLGNALAEMGLRVFNSAANFLFVKLDSTALQADELRELLVRQHRILIRSCDSFDGLKRGRYIRVAVRSGAENDTLVNALERVL